ncbi:unnamed protein product [Caenorhabditis angaria]|uniref:Laminin G domain-containing protein n=1 Tax=Caenorhabditis angaria TaxID=860376 RepID=A0A9P1IAF0_9PELO|nr:unnamed protein product [Caenorhabditis angaria]
MDEKKIEKCLRNCENGSCYEKIRGELADDMICREHEIKDKRGMHLNEHTELSYPNNATFSVSSTLSSNFSFDFRTLSEYGVLWFEGGFSQSEENSDFLIIFVDESKLYIGVNLGEDNSLKPISTNLTVSDNHWHTVEFRRKERKCELWTDGRKVLTIVTSPGNNTLDTNGIAYLGGPKKHRQLKSLGLITKFVGCVRNLKIFGSPVNLLIDSLTNIRQPNYCHN